jgi:DNA-binding NarL/FixJ family response regulator
MTATSHQPPVRVLVVDDQTLFREALTTLLEVRAELEVVGTAENGAQALELVDALRPDVVLMDLRMPVLDGVATTTRLAVEHPTVRVLVLTTFDGDDEVFPALRAGAVGYLLKDADPEDVLDGVRTVSRGGSPLHPKVARELLTARGPVPAHEGQLTPREAEVLGLVKAGLANKQIARRLGISERTVKAHLTSVFQRIGVADRTQAALWAERNL